MLAAHPSFPVRTIQELVEYAKANPGKVNWRRPHGAGDTGNGVFRIRAGVKVVHVPYKGAGPALVGLLGGNVDLLFAIPGVFMPHLKAGRLRAIGIGSLERIAILPDVPTLNESGFPGLESGSWYGLVAPTATPARVIKFTHAAVVKVLNLPVIAARLAADGSHSRSAIRQNISPKGFGRHRDAKVISEAGIKVE